MKIIVGDILQSKSQTLINTVNCVGVMGKGIALEFKKRFPGMFEDYVARCERGEVRPGVPHIYKTLFPPYVINFPTKDHWRSVSKLSDIEHGMKYLLEHYKEWGVTSLAIPPLGCGNGQLDWKVVGPLIYRYAKKMDIPVEMCAPYGTPPNQLTVEFMEKPIPARSAQAARLRDSKLNPAWVALVEILRRVESEPYHWPVGRTIFQKMAFIATREGLPTGFQYQRASFGPFSRDLKEALARLVNSNVIQEERQGNWFKVKVGPGFEKVRKDHEEQMQGWLIIIEKTTDLFMRMDTRKAEVVATVLFANDELRRGKKEITEVEVLKSVMAWKQKRRPPLEESEVASTIRNLGILNWLRANPSNDLPITEDESVSACLM